VLEELQRVPPVGAEAIERLFLTVRGESCPLNLKAGKLKFTIERPMKT
jgi:hypothetical protein